MSMSMQNQSQLVSSTMLNGSLATNSTKELVVASTQGPTEKDTKAKDTKQEIKVTAVYTLDQLITEPVAKHIIGLGKFQIVNSIVHSICKLIICSFYFNQFGIGSMNYLLLQELITVISNSISDILYSQSLRQISTNLLVNEKKQAEEQFGVSLIASIITSILSIIILNATQNQFKKALQFSNEYNTAFTIQTTLQVIILCYSNGFYHRYRLENRRMLIFSQQILNSTLHLVITGMCVFFGKDQSASQISYIICGIIHIFWNFLILGGHSLWHIPLFAIFELKIKDFWQQLRDPLQYKQALQLIIKALPNILSQLTPSLTAIIVLGQLQQSSPILLFVYCFYGSIFKISQTIAYNLLVIVLVNQNDNDRIKNSIVKSLILAIGVSTVLAVIGVLFQAPILEFFVSSEMNVLLKASSYVKSSALFAGLHGIFDTFVQIAINFAIAKDHYYFGILNFISGLISIVIMISIRKQFLAISDNAVRSVFFCDVFSAVGAVIYISTQLFKTKNQNKQDKKKVKKAVRSIDEELARAQ
ncbi:DinF_protein [Hexamita inflata]|uniref:DinF protein n=1 Tax=Hexamita inflata TaxID=28002 RepID=A0AA86TYQ7_9EUKA|nr:DinF protein [Hexamita inflata]